MSKNWFKSIGTVDETGALDGVDISHLKAGTVMVFCHASTSPAWDGTAQVEGSNDGTNYVEMPTLTEYDPNKQDASIAYRVPTALKFVRVNCPTDYTAGSLVCTVGGEIANS